MHTDVIAIHLLQAEGNQQSCSAKFEKLSDTGKQELQAFKIRRVVAFRKNLVRFCKQVFSQERGIWCIYSLL